MEPFETMIKLRYAIKMDVKILKDEIELRMKEHNNKEAHWEDFICHNMIKIKQSLRYLDEIDARLERIAGIEHPEPGYGAVYETSYICNLEKVSERLLKEWK